MGIGEWVVSNFMKGINLMSTYIYTKKQIVSTFEAWLSLVICVYLLYNMSVCKYIGQNKIGSMHRTAKLNFIWQFSHFGDSLVSLRCMVMGGIIGVTVASMMLNISTK